MKGLRANGLAIGHGRTVLLEGIDAVLPGGTLVALMGANGAGKSTLLRTLAGLQAPLAGQVLAGGADVHGLPAARRAKQIAVVLTGRPPAGSLDVETLVALGRQPWTNRWGRITREDRQAVEHALQCTGAGPLRHKLLSTCSDGECQKVMIARAVAQATPVLLLDEPTAFLDLPNRAAMVRMLRNIAHREHKLVLFSTHDLQLAMDLCDSLVLLRSGRSIWQGTPRQAMESGELAAVFAGSGVAINPETGTHRFVP